MHKISYRDAVLKSIGESPKNQNIVHNNNTHLFPIYTYVISDAELSNLNELLKIPKKYLDKELLLKSLKRMNGKLSDINWDSVSLCGEDLDEYKNDSDFKKIKECVDYFESLYASIVPKKEYDMYLEKYSFKPITGHVRIVPDWVEHDDKIWTEL